MSPSNSSNASTHHAVIELETPLQRGDQSIDTITLRKPVTGELHGFNMVEIIQMSISALHLLLPRITTPVLSKVEIAALDLVDLAKIAAEISHFFTSQKDQIPAPSQNGSKT